MKHFIIFSILSIFILSCQATKSNSTSSIENEVDGKALYQTTCLACHGMDGRLTANGSTDLSKSKMTLKEVIEITANGKEGTAMISYNSIYSPKEIEAIAKYVLTLQKD